MTPQLKQSKFWSDPGPGIFNAKAVRRWNETRKQTERAYAASHVQPLPAWEQALVQIARVLWRVAITALVFGVPFVTFRILAAFASGRVHEILDALQKVSR